MHADEVYSNDADRHRHDVLDPYQAVRDDVPLHEVAGRYTVLQKVRNGHVGRCPLHAHPNHPFSFHCYPDGRWECSNCGQDGDVVDLEFHLNDCAELWEAMVSLADDYNVRLPGEPRSWFSRKECQDG